MEDKYSRFFNKDVWKAILFAFLILLVGQAVLTWQYYRLKEKQLPIIEERLEEQERKIAEQSAKELLSRFLEARVLGDAAQLNLYLTENAVALGFESVQGVERYEVDETAEIEQGFQFQVTFLGAQGLVKNIEIIRVRKILDLYYIDSILPAG